MFSKTIEEEQKPNPHNDFTIDSFRYVKIARDDEAAFKNAEMKFFPCHTTSHQMAKADDQGVYHQNYQMSYTLKHWRFYVEITYATGTRNPALQSFQYNSNNGVESCHIDGMPLFDFLNQYKATTNKEYAASIETFMADHKNSMFEIEKNKSLLSYFFPSADDSRSAQYVDNIVVDKLEEQKRDNTTKRFIGLDKYRISAEDPYPKQRGMAGFGHFEDESKPIITAFTCEMVNKAQVDPAIIKDYNLWQPSLDGGVNKARCSIINGDNIFFIQVEFIGQSYKEVTLDLGHDRTIETCTINNHDLYDIIRAAPTQTQDMAIFLTHFLPSAFEEAETFLSSMMKGDIRRAFGM